MADVAFIAVVIAFFAVAGAFVLLCDRIIGPADEATTAQCRAVLTGRDPSGRGGLE